MAENKDLEDLEMDDSSDITRGCVDPVVNICLSVGQAGTLLSVLTLIKSCGYCKLVTEGLEGISLFGMSCIYIHCFPTVSSPPPSSPRCQSIIFTSFCLS